MNKSLTQEVSKKVLTVYFSVWQIPSESLPHLRQLSPTTGFQILGVKLKGLQRPLLKVPWPEKCSFEVKSHDTFSAGTVGSGNWRHSGGTSTQCPGVYSVYTEGSSELTHAYLSIDLSKTQMAMAMAKSQLESQVQSKDATITEASIFKSPTTHEAWRWVHGFIQCVFAITLYVWP